ncbi:ABC transporter permease [Clostridium thermosuccinogenes]|uniref:ABC transporter permease n=2 Tax=Clostridium thermosuccinogenes TaxID=84032 RepID=A0A2K2EZ86_9CLOT|nr:ABC transporter permease [Pseudoclostridium thermosuccinogenes]PNT91848.1 ABC transporter permease [Pseudoclostridium thermosuccinogenes]PNT94422.1 ABC transporter permease [Pseudoclostridium thermosuccinogenes]PNT94588.1 ABC transporter permease [Pseudoclostridium thermosuccinogenes]
MSMGEKIFQTFNTLLLTLLGISTLYPMIYILVVSLNEGQDSMKGGLFLWPRVFTLFNYQFVLGNGLIQNAYMITIGRTVLGTILGIALTAFVAYGLSFRNLPYKKFILFLMLIPMLFNGGLIPYYLQLNRLKLINTFWVYVIPGLFNIWNMFVMRRFFMDIPESLRESAIIDGANEVVVLFRIILPLSLPMLAALSLFTAVGHWNDWFSGAFYVNDNKLIPVQTYLQRLLSADSLSMIFGNNRMIGEAAFRQTQVSKMTVTSIKMAAVMIGTLPILCLYPFLQKYFIKGVLIGSIKE